MSELYRLETDNENSLQELNWAIATSGGEFSLILALCNATSVRRRLMQTLQASSEVEIQEIVLDKSVKTIYQTIQNSIREQHPQALVVSGLESVNHLEQVLITANQVREEFRKNFHFPLVLWVTDEVLQKLIRVAPDLHSWSTTVEFAIASADLINFIEQTADEIFTRVLAAGAGRYLDQVALNLQIGSSRRVELEAAANELQNRRLSLSLELEASLEFMLGRATANFMEESRQHYERSLALFEQTDQFLERRAAVLYSLGIWWSTFAVLYLPEQESSRATSTEYLQKCIAVFEQANRRDLAAKFINALGVVLQQLQRWEELEAVANKALVLHQIYEHPLKLARAYSFKAEVALAKSIPDTAKAAAEQALSLLDNYQRNIQQPVSEETKADLEWENSYHRGWYLFALGRSQAALNQPELALQTLETAKTDTKAQYDPELYIGILAQLRDNYFKKCEYLTAFNIKQYRRSIEQQYSYRAFIGAGRLQPQQQVNNPALALAENSDTVAQEIAASGRQPDIKRLIERMGRHDHKLTIIHGQSGVGKSSILQAGLIPALKQKSIGTRDVLPVLQQVYPDWLRELGDRLKEAIANLTPLALKPYEGEDIPIFTDDKSILEQFVKHDDYNLLTVLIFDQFEEFFFVYKDPASRKPFYEFLRECLDIPFVKVILSLREDYLYYLLECNNRLADFEVINNNILDKDILYYLDNFSPEDARAVIHILTAKTPFVFEPSLVDELVKDLARDLGEVRPIELQVVGVQLQTERITKLEKYQQQGPKEKFVGRFLEEIVQDCGTENEQIAKLVLYLLTDENNLRPLKTRADLELELEVQPEKLDLILEILIKSGLIFKIPAVPAERYQLVHDYLVPFVRQQQSERLIKELEKEREQRKLTEAKLNEVLKQQLLETRRGLLWKVSLGTITGALAIFLPLILVNQNNAQLLAMSGNAKGKLNSNRDLEALIETIKAGKRLQQWWSIGVKPETAMQVKTALQDAVYTTREINTLEGHTDSVTKVSFSLDGQKIVSGSADGRIIIWSRKGTKLKDFKAHDKKITSLGFSPNGQNILSGSEDKTLKLWSLEGDELTKFPGHEDEVTSFSFSPDGQKIISGGKDGKLKLWNLKGEEIKSEELIPFEGHDSSINSVSFSPDGRLIASISEDYTIKIWNHNGKKIKTLKNINGSSVSFSPDNQSVAIFGLTSSNIKLRSVDGSFIQDINFNGITYILSWSSDTKTINVAGIDFSSYNDITVSTIQIDQGSRVNFTLKGHRNTITSLNFSPDGKMLVSGSEDKTVKLWSLEKSSFQFPNERRINEVVFSPNPQTVASIDDASTATLWQRDGISKATLPGSNTKIYFSADSQMLVSASQDSTVQLWQQNGTLLKTLSGEFVDGSFSTDGRSIALVQNDNSVNLFSTDGKLIKSLANPEDKVEKIRFSPDGEIIATVSQNKLKIWLRKNGKLITTMNSNIQNIGFSRNGKNLAILDKNNVIKFLRLDGQLKLIKSLKSKNKMSINFSHDGEIVAISNRIKDNEEAELVEIWRMDGTLLTTLRPLEESQTISETMFTNDGRTIVTVSSSQEKFLFWRRDGHLISTANNTGIYSPDYQIFVKVDINNTVRLLKQNGTLIKTIKVKSRRINLSENSDSAFRFSPDSKILAIRTGLDTIELWHTDGTFLTTIQGIPNSKTDRFGYFNDASFTMSFSSDSQTLAISTSDNAVQFWKINGKKVTKILNLQSFKEPSNRVSDVIAIPNSNKIAIIGGNDTTKLWRISSNSVNKIHLLKSLPGHKNSITSVRISPNGDMIAAASEDKTVKIWGIKGNLIKNFTEHKDKVNSISFSLDNKLIASASDDKTVKVWQLNGQVIKSFEEHGNGVTNVNFSPDGKLIASASKDNTVKIWSLDQEKVTPLNNYDTVTSISFSPDGKMIASADPKTVKIWSIEGTLLSTYERFGNSSVSFSPDGKSIASAGDYNRISVWDFDLNQLLKRGCDAARDYLKNNPKAESDRHLCDDIYNQKQ
ncbi:eIF2A-related protein [Nostoc sp. FACHB-110]|uniref:WD40 domain-containing protein n=1 Tax=Nostoc sp. FACHB-110 TaxID=2692834 RepID=UPI001682E7DD|nr:hypothetical protein [Nostoc sp. FACHB-110]MBD2437711.1 hypothetical protein [Nostoc sp. FACHB-110]